MVSRTTSLLDSMHTTKTVASYSTATEILCERAEPEFRCRIGPCFRPGRQPAVEPAAPLSRHYPMMHGTPARVLAQHLGRNLRFKGSPLCDRPRSNSCRHQCRSRQVGSEHACPVLMPPAPHPLRSPVTPDLRRHPHLPPSVML